MRLLTIQSNRVRLSLARNGVYRPAWSYVGNDPDWIGLYRMMATAMQRRGLSTNGRPPVWAWPCDPRLGGPMTLDHALFFLGGPEQARRVWVIELDAPDHLCLLCSYRDWQDIVYGDRDSRPTNLSGLLARRLRTPGTRVHAQARLDPDAYQVCLPMLRREWVRDVRPLRGPPGHDLSTEWPRTLI